MKANLTLLVLSILVSISIFSCTEKKETPKEATAEELSQMNRDFVKALNARDAVAAANCYTEETGSNGDLGYEIGRLQMKIKMPDGKIVG